MTGLLAKLKKPTYPELGPFTSLCHEAQYAGKGCRHGQRGSHYRCVSCVHDVGLKLARALIRATSTTGLRK